MTQPPRPRQDNEAAMPDAPANGGLSGSRRPLSAVHDVALMDLDGVCFAGSSPVPHAADSINAARLSGMALTFVTNNASRAPQAVVDKLGEHGIDAEIREVFSAAMDGAAMLREHLDPGAPVLVIGGEGLRLALVEEGFVVVDSADDHPAAVVQGWDPAVDWAMMSEGVYAISRGALHVATNTDATLPTERGFALGNGSLVAAVSHASGRDFLAAGKPRPGIYRRALARGEGRRPLAVGDRLDTDLVGARAAGIPGLHVLTGVSSAREVLLAPPDRRPTYLHTDLRGLVESHPEPRRVELEARSWWRVGGCAARCEEGVLSWRAQSAEPRVLAEGAEPLTLDAYRALACAAWDYLDEHGQDASALSVPEIEVRDGGRLG